MANELSIFSNEEFGSVRVIVQDGEPWFIASDVAKALGYERPNDAVNTHCKKVNKFSYGDSPRGAQPYNIIPESDVYRLIMRSNLPNAERFQDWVVEEVLPSIRKTGNYSMAPASAPGVRPLRDIAAIYEAAGIHGNQLALALDKFYKAESGMSALEVAGVSLKAPMQTNMLTPTEIGAMLNPTMSAKSVNRFLEFQGLQYRLPNGKWEPTELADKYGYVLLDTNKKHSDGTPVTQLKWSTKVLSLFRK